MGRAEESKGKWGRVPMASYIAYVKVAFLRVTLLSSLLKHWYQTKHWEILLFESIPLLISYHNGSVSVRLHNIHF